MTQPIVSIEATPMSRFQRHKFLLMVGATIVTSLLLVTIALIMYASNGTEQLDLSRPGFKSIGPKAAVKKDFNTFPSSGPIDTDAVKKFESLYDTSARKVTSAQAFQADPIGATINAPSADVTEQ